MAAPVMLDQQVQYQVPRVLWDMLEVRVAAEPKAASDILVVKEQQE
jgi:hypothetical protein